MIPTETRCNKMNILRQTIRQVIMEAVRESELSNMCLMHAEVGVKNYYLLFGKPFLKDAIEAYQHEDDSPPDDVIGVDPVEAIRFNQIKQAAKSPHIYGMMIAAPYWNWSCRDAWEVTLAAAQPGWGPTMYDIVMGEAPNGIIADRSSVSKHAKKIYDFYFNKRSDVKKYPLDWAEKRWTSTTRDDCDWGSDAAWSLDIWDTKDPDDMTQEDWHSDTLNFAYNKYPISDSIRTALDDNFLDVMRDLEDADILSGSYEDWKWWRDIMIKFFDVQKAKRKELS